jgi:hypothetical protein
MENILNFFKINDTILSIEDKKAQTRLDALSDVASSGSYNDLSDKPTISYDQSTSTISFKNF